MSLRIQTLNGVKWTSVSSLILTIIQLIQLVIVARYLDPSDFGLMAMASVVIGFSTMFVDMGISGAIIHEQEITHSQLSSLYWLNIILGLLIFLSVFLIAPYVSKFYGEAELTPIIQLLSLTFVISSVSDQFKILYQKNLKFELMAKVDIAIGLLSFGTAVGFAVNGYGVYALVYAGLISSVFSTFVYVYLGLKIHRPSLIYRYSEIKRMIEFGAYRLGAMNLNYFNSQFDVILIGKLLGPEALGIYSVAKNLSMRPAGIINPIITKVTFPVMSTMQNDTEKLKFFYLKTINYLSSVNFPVYVLMAMLAEPIILILFSEKWTDSIIILQILSIYAMIRSTGNPVGSLQLAKGKTYMGFWWNLGLFFLIPISIYMGSYWGLVGIAYALLGLQVLLLIPNWYLMVNPLCGASFKEYFWQILQPLISAIISGLFAYGMSLQIDTENMYFNVGLITLVMGTVVLVLNVLFNREFIDTLLELVRKRKIL